MKYEVVVHREALKALLKLDKKTVQRIRSEIAALTANPRPTASRKLIGLENCYRVRSGTYRILYRVDDAEKKVFVYRIAHRKESYR